jgi:hypothetical protein
MLLNELRQQVAEGTLVQVRNMMHEFGLDTTTPGQRGADRHRTLSARMLHYISTNPQLAEKQLQEFSRVRQDAAVHQKQQMLHVAKVKKAAAEDNYARDLAKMDFGRILEHVRGE